jgi:glutamyl-tRNA reductase
MTPEEKQKADAWMTLQTGDVVTDRIQRSFGALFERPEVASWLASRMVEAESRTMRTPLRTYYEQQLERNLRMILADGMEERIERVLRPMVREAVNRHTEQVSKDLAELKKLRSKGPIHGKR